MNRRTVIEHLCINTRDDSAIASLNGLGMEVVDYLTAQCLDDRETKALVDERLRGIERRIVHGPFNELIPATEDPLIRRVVFRRFNSTFRVARHHQATKVVFHSGFMPRTAPAQRWVTNSVGFWKEYMEGKPSGFFVCIENVCDDEPELLAGLIDEIGDSRVSLCLDIGHAQANSSRPLHEWVETLGRRIRHVHLHNNDGELDKHWPLNRGVINMTQTLDLLLQHAPCTTYTLECDPTQSLSWLYEYCGEQTS